MVYDHQKTVWDTIILLFFYEWENGDPEELNV